ncbi:hypothetical protein CPB97_006027, partial [Podila verticillata]
TSLSKMRFFILAVALSAIAMTQVAPAPVDKRGDVAGQGSAHNHWQDSRVQSHRASCRMH